MATADTEDHHSERDCGHTLFSKQYSGKLILKIVKLDSVVQKFIDSKTLSHDECKSLSKMRIADQRLRYLLTIINDYCNRNNLLAFKTFIDILGDTGNVNVAQHISVIYTEREHYVATLSVLSKEKSLVRNLKDKISSLETNLEGKGRSLEILTNDKKIFVDKNVTFRKEKFSLEEQVKKKEEDRLFVESEIEKLTRTKKDLEDEVESKSRVIRQVGQDIADKDQKIREAIEESNCMRLEIDTLQLQHREAMVKNQNLSKKIEKLESEIDEKEKTIMNLRKSKAMTREEIEEEWRNRTKTQMALIKQQGEKIDLLTEAQMTSRKEMKEEIDLLKEAQMISRKEHSEKIDSLRDAVMQGFKIQEKK